MKGLRLAAAILAVLMAFLLCSCGKDKETIDEQLYEEDLEPASSIVINEEEAEVLNEKVPVCLYFGDEQKSKLVKEIRYLDIDEAKKGVSTLASAIVKELISGPKAKGLTNVLPEGVTLRAPVTVEGRVATVDLTREFIDNHPGGKTMEELSVYSIVNALTELKEIERVKIIINGKQAKNFKGNLTLDKEFPRNEAVINKEVGMARPEDGGLVPVSAEEPDPLTGEEDPLE
ncbi:MAG: GerMN domain-containing protein [Clostridiaceae bacterium]|jgi:germination protein M|nr:GerMN domain-containing protein [Clostridiaceae bacterium]